MKNTIKLMQAMLKNPSDKFFADMHPNDFELVQNIIFYSDQLRIKAEKEGVSI